MNNPLERFCQRTANCTNTNHIRLISLLDVRRKKNLRVRARKFLGCYSPVIHYTTIMERSIEVLGCGLQGQAFISVRTDGKPGSGTAADPFDGSTPDKFRDVMLAIQPYSEVTLLPGVYETRGHCLQDEEGSWKPKIGWRLQGCGMGRTILKLVDVNREQGNYCVIRALYTNGQIDFPRYGYGGGGINHPEWLEIMDMTIDCNGAAHDGLQANTQGVHSDASHSLVRRVRVMNWTTDASECFPISIGFPIYYLPPTNLNAVIEYCVVDRPHFLGTGSSTAIGIFFGEMSDGNQSFDLFSVIRGCTIDGVFSDGYMPEWQVTPSEGRCLGHALSPGGGRMSVVEGNFISNYPNGGPYLDTWATKDHTIRNNKYWNVGSGPYWNSGGRSPAREFVTERLIIENNEIALMLKAKENPDQPFGIGLMNWSFPNRTTPIVREAIVRHNHIHLIDGNMDMANPCKAGMMFNHIEHLIVEENHIRLPYSSYVGAGGHIWTDKIGRVTSRNNRRPEDGSTIPVWDATNKRFILDCDQEMDAKLAALRTDLDLARTQNDLFRGQIKTLQDQVRILQAKKGLFF